MGGRHSEEAPGPQLYWEASYYSAVKSPFGVADSCRAFYFQVYTHVAL